MQHYYTYTTNTTDTHSQQTGCHCPANWDEYANPTYTETKSVRCKDGLLVTENDDGWWGQNGNPVSWTSGAMPLPLMCYPRRCPDAEYMKQITDAPNKGNCNPDHPGKGMDACEGQEQQGGVMSNPMAGFW